MRQPRRGVTVDLVRSTPDVRVITGEAKGRRLKGPPGPQTRPMADKIKEAVFSALEALGVDAARGPAPHPGTAAAAPAGTPRPRRRRVAEKRRGAVLPARGALGVDAARVLDLYAGTGAVGIEALS